VFPDSYSPQSAFFSNKASATFHREYYRHNLQSPVIGLVVIRDFLKVCLHFENSSYIVSVHYMFKLSRNTYYIKVTDIKPSV
jgi:hypothetical protein